MVEFYALCLRWGYVSFSVLATVLALLGLLLLCLYVIDRVVERFIWLIALKEICDAAREMGRPMPWLRRYLKRSGLDDGQEQR